MFTGIIEAVGSIKNIEPVGGDVRLHVDVGSLDLSDVQLGDSIAVNGVCLTAIEFDKKHFVADVSNETITLTSLKSLSPGSQVNLEKALLPTTRLGGHLVSGHVDGLGEVVSIKEESRSIQLIIRSPGGLKHYIAMKGSICIDGTSLTVNKITNTDFVLIKRHLLGLPSRFDADFCDVNGDAQCTNTDAVLIQRTILGLPPGLRQTCAAAGN